MEDFVEIFVFSTTTKPVMMCISIFNFLLICYQECMHIPVNMTRGPPGADCCQRGTMAERFRDFSEQISGSNMYSYSN